MSWQTVSRIFRLGVTNFWRNRWLSLTATLIMTITLLIISFFAILTLTIGKTTNLIKSKMDISIYFKDSANVDQIVDLQRKLASRSDVKQVKYVSKEEALENFKVWGKNVAQYATAEDLPRSLEIKATQAEYLDQIAQYLNQDEYKPIIDRISYQDNKSIIERLILITSFVKKFGWILSIGFVLISIFVILNTIRLAILTRQEEIEVMRLVGASDIFIRVPFIVEGLLYGFLATILAVFVLKISVWILSPLITHHLGEAVNQRMLAFFSEHFLAIIGLEFLVGITVGISCSLISIRRYLKV